MNGKAISKSLERQSMKLLGSRQRSLAKHRRIGVHVATRSAYHYELLKSAAKRRGVKF